MYSKPVCQRDCNCDDARVCPSMNVTGKGSVKASPDTAVVTVGAVTEDKDLDKARQENALRINRVIEVLESMGVEEKDIQTLSYNIDMTYDFQEGKQIFRGYKVSNVLKVFIRNTEDIGILIDAALKNGANFVGNVDFILSKPDIYYRRALQMAIRDAYEKAHMIAKGIDVSLNPVPISITEESYGVSPIEPYPRFKADITSAQTPIQTGEIEIRASVKMVFTY